MKFFDRRLSYQIGFDQCWRILIFGSGLDFGNLSGGLLWPLANLVFDLYLLELVPEYLVLRLDFILSVALVGKVVNGGLQTLIESDLLLGPALLGLMQHLNSCDVMPVWNSLDGLIAGSVVDAVEVLLINVVDVSVGLLSVERALAGRKGLFLSSHFSSFR